MGPLTRHVACRWQENDPTEEQKTHSLFRLPFSSKSNGTARCASIVCCPRFLSATRHYGNAHLWTGTGTSERRGNSIRCDKVSGDGMEEDLSISSSTLARSFQERIFTHQKLFRDFCDALEYQIQFDGCRMLTILE